MNQEELLAFYMHAYTKADLASLLANFALAGEFPPIPHERPQILSFGRGRPDEDTRNFKWDLLVEAITEHYPVQVDVAMLAVEAGMMRATVKGLQQDLEFLIKLKAPFNDYFISLPEITASRLTSVWRAVLDLHNYKSALNDPGVLLPFYQMHALFWTGDRRKVVLSNKYILQRNAAERRRLWNSQFVAVLKRLGWPIPKGFNMKYDPAVAHPWPCALGCPITRAYKQKADVYNIAGARELLGDFDWLPQKRTVVEATTALDAVKQITGLE
jgi:hypothetical protein